MPRKSQHGDKRERSNITWGEVTQLCAEVGASTRMRIEVACYVIQTGGQSGMLRVEARAYDWTEATWTAPKHLVSSLWPCLMSATMTGLYTRLLHQLDHVVYHARQAEERERRPLGA